ncbi:hypothetical protein ACF1A4_30375 [Streptomyces albidoflavus]
MLSIIEQIAPTLFVGLCALGLVSDPAAPCGPDASRSAATLADHLRAIGNHARAAAALLADKVGKSGNGDQDGELRE